MEDEELTAMLLKLQEQFARLFTTAVKRQGKGSLVNIRVVVDKVNMYEAMPFKTLTPVRYGIFQDLGTGNRSGNPKKDEMYKRAKSELSRVAPPIARKFSKGNRGGIKASFYQSIPSNLFTRYEQAATKVLVEYTQSLVNKFPNV